MYFSGFIINNRKKQIVLHVPTEEILRNMVPFPSKVKIESHAWPPFRKHFSKLLQQGRSALDSSLLADFNEKRREKAHTGAVWLLAHSLGWRCVYWVHYTNCFSNNFYFGSTALTIRHNYSVTAAWLFLFSHKS